MKKIFSFFEIRYNLIFIMSLCMVGCDKVFDQPNVGSITPDEVWTNPDNVKLFVNNFYGILPAWNRFETFTEEGGESTINSFLGGRQQTTSSFPGEVNWENAYATIRGMNTFFREINMVPMEEEEKDLLKGEVYFLLAFQYFQMLKVYGGVPLVTELQDPLDSETTRVTRNTSLECFDFILQNLDRAIELLPHTWPASDLGRITKGAAMVVKADVLMLKASPLFNPSQYRLEYWNDAYEAYSNALIELNNTGKGLYTVGGPMAYTNMWYDKAGAQKEMILQVRYQFPDKTFSLAGQRPLSVSVGAAGSCQPTWEMVKAYPMKNGKAIDDIDSGYDPNYFWVDRDPRFYQTIVYNGATYGFPGETDRVQWIFPDVYPDGYLGQLGTRTGFYTRKQIDTTLSPNEVSQQAFDWPIIRYAEVLLNFAECAAEIGRPDIAKEQIVLVRQRAGIVDDGDGNYGLKAEVGVDREATIEAIMRERQIELAYEGKRFWDLRRRRMYDILNAYGTFHANGPYLADTRNTVADTTGMNLKDIADITGYFNSLLKAPPQGTSANNIINAVTDYRVEVIDRSTTNVIHIPETYYFWPLHPNWIQTNPNLVQNEGWDNGTFNPTIQ